MARVSRSWQNDAGELYTEGATWEEDSSNPKRLVHTTKTLHLITSTNDP